MAAETGKKPYRGPKLICYGSVSEVTRECGVENADEPEGDADTACTPG